MKKQNNAKELVNELNTLPRPVELTFVRSKGNKRACELCDPACKAERAGVRGHASGASQSQSHGVLLSLLNVKFM